MNILCAGEPAAVLVESADGTSVGMLSSQEAVEGLLGSLSRCRLPCLKLWLCSMCHAHCILKLSACQVMCSCHGSW